MKLSKGFTAFAASYFAIVFLKNGTLEKLTNDAARGARTFVKGSRTLTKIT